MVTLVVKNKDDKVKRELHLTEDDLVNKRFNRQNSILDISLNNNLDIPYGCMGGSCSACVCELVKGKDAVDKEGLHEQVYKGIGEEDILTCISTIKQDLPPETEIIIKTKF